jgi:hypothetical protein
MKMSDNEETTETTTSPAAPAWMATQAPKVITGPVEMVDDNTVKLPKTRKPRRTKAQMLADAAARPDAENTYAKYARIPAPIELDPAIPPITASNATFPLSTIMAAEDHRDAVVRDVARIVPRINRTWYERHRHHVPLAVAIAALILAIVK